MSYSQKIQTILARADIKKVTERRECIQNLSDILSNDEVVEEITKSSKPQNVKKHGYLTWNMIFLKCHQLILDETRKNTSSSAKTTLQIQNDCCSLLLNIARYASKPCEVYLKCSDLKSILFEVLESDIFKFAYNTYVKILTDYVLSNRMHRVLILLEDWKKMLEVFRKLYEQASIRKDIALQVLQQIVNYGCFQSHLVHDVKMMLPFLLNVFDDVTTDPTILAKPAFKLIYTVCKEIVADSRKALCEFSEKILSRMISIDGDSDKYKLLLLFVTIHHPNGVISNAKSAYAHDWKQWRRAMIITYKYILKNIKSTFILPSFTALASEVFKQILEDRIYHEEESNLDLETSRQAKRQRLSSDIKKLSDFFNVDFSNVDIESKWYVGEVLGVMVDKYPSILNVNDFLSLLEIVSELFAEAIKNVRAVDSLCKLCKSLLKAESILSDGLMFAESTKKYWEKIQHILLRILGLKQNEKEGHELLQLLITYFNMSLVNELLCLYINNEIQWSPFSVNSLYIACQYINIPYYIEKYPFQHGDLVKNRLINWILNIPVYKSVNSTTVVILGKILIYLTLKTWNRDSSNNPVNQIIFHDKTFSNDDEFSNLLCSISKYYLSLSLELDVFTTNTVTPCINNHTKLAKPSLSENTLSFIIEKLCELIRDHQKDDESISKLIFELTIVATFISNLLEINVESSHKQLQTLRNLFNQSITNLYTFISEKNLLDRKHMYIIDLIRALITLYETPYQHNVAIIIEKCPREFLLKSLELLNFENNEELGRLEEDLGIKYYEYIFEFRDCSQSQQRSKRLSNHVKVSDDHAITIGAHKIITLFGCIDSGREILPIQQKVLENLLQVNIYAPTLIGNFWQALVFLKKLIKCRVGFFSKEFIKTVIKFIKELFQQWKDDGNAAKGIINLLPSFFEHVMLTDNSTQEILELVLYAHNLISKNKFGSQVYLDFIKSLFCVIQEASSFKLLSNVSAQKTVITDVVLKYVENSFWIVRLETINILREIFQSKHVNISTKRTLLRNIEKCVLNLFIVDGNSSTAIQQDQWDSIMTTGLYIFGSIIHSIGSYQTEALNFLLRLYGEKKVPINTIHKILDLAIKNKNYKTKLIEINLYSLMTNWMNGKYASQKFPWMLTQSTSEQEFFKTHMDIFIMMKLETHQLSIITSMCEKLGCTFAEIIEANFASIIAWLLANMSRNSNIDSYKNHEQYANQIFLRLSQNQQEFENVMKLSVLIKNKIADILVNIIQRFHDSENFTDMFDEQFIGLPRINLPDFNNTTVKKCFYHLETFCPALGNCLISFLTMKDPSVMQQVLLILSNNIYDYSMIEYKLVAFHQYAFFCDFLVQKISKELFNNMAMYFLKDICYTLLHLINNEADILPKITARFFYKFLKNSLPSRSKEISKILDFIVVSLISAIQKSKIDNIGLKILYFLMTYSTDSIKCAVSKLDAFPSDSSFDKIRDIHLTLKDSADNPTLRNEIEIFLNLRDEKIITYNYEVLPYLRQVLHDKKKELILMYKDLEMLRGFTEDCKSSVLHRLIYKLMKLTENSNKTTALEIAKCLGELGPANLMTMILHSEENQVKEIENFEERFMYEIIITLINYFESNNINLKKASTNALYKVCSTAQSREILTSDYLDTYEDSKESTLLDLTRPFINKKNTAINSVLKLNIENCKKYISSQNNLWRSNTIQSYAEWIVKVSCEILSCFENFYFSSLISICELNIEFAELILPKLVYLMILTNANIADNICKCIDQFFEEKLTFIKLKQNDLTNKVQKIDPFSYKSMKCMLNIINFVRIQCSNNFMLKLNYLYIAKAAQYCSAHFSSIFYAELYCEILKKSITRMEDNVFIIDHICEKINADDGKTLQNILWEAFKHIGDPDSIHGCGLSHLKHPSSRIQYYVYSQQWDKVMGAEDAELSSGDLTFNGITTALRHSGFDYLLSRFTSTLSDHENINECMYETAWRLSDWNISPNQQYLTQQNSKTIKNIINDDHNYYYCHYQALKCFYENDNASLTEYVDNARISIIKSSQKVSLECSETIYPKLVKLQMLLELEQMATMKDENLLELISSWDSQNLSTSNNDFIHVEPILAQRIVMYKIKYSVDNFSYLKKALINTYLQLSEIAEIQGHTHIAARLLICLAKENNLTEEIQHQLQYRDALLNWTRKDYEVARYLMRDLISKNELNPSLNGEALRIYGNWMAETKSENPQSIIEKYYEKSIEITSEIVPQSQNNMDSLNDTYAVLAQFADTQYRQINTFMKTPQYESLKECAKYAAKATSISSVTDSDVKRALNTFQRQNTIDVAEYENIQSEQKMYLEYAVKYYLITLETGEKHNFFIFRMISLWLNNKDNNELNKLFAEHLRKIPCYKFIPLIPQLAPHLSEQRNSIFKSEIYELLKRCTKEHPHHTLPILLALINTHKDYDYNPNNSIQLKPNERERGAKSLILEFTDNKIYPIIAEMKKVAEALISLAYHEFNGRPMRHRIPETQSIHYIQNFQHCVVSTITLNVQPIGKYDDIVSIYKYENYFEGVGGVNAPKKIVCIGTDGIKRKQLVKGKDDLKQDAVMQQVFTVMNLLLGASKETKRRKLNIRTYKVIPLSQRSGVLEWCDNTQPIISLVGTSNSTGMHKKYYPNDWQDTVCRTKIKDAANKSNLIRKKVYLQCCENLHPVLHFFFMDTFPSPEVWFERRLAYIRSIATNSMVGYILGLGDRHFSNILIDKMSAEVIHIDFGIAFEQGKVLLVPETVPFRLTRNIEAAMGVSGVEGVMRKCCEETMTVLRNRKDIIITLLQVLLYDPLFSWTITPAKAWELQSDGLKHSNKVYEKGEDKFNKIAEKALLRIEQKLQGTEDGLPTSITGQVERLIQEARDPANLSRLYCGWQAYL